MPEREGGETVEKRGHYLMGAGSAPPLAAALRQLEEIRVLLPQCHRLDAVKGLRDRAQAVLYLTKQRDCNLDIQNAAAEAKVRCERRLGELLAGRVRAGKPKLLHDETISRLPDGVSRIQSHRWQQLAGLGARQFEGHVSAVKAKRQELTTAG